MAILTPERVYDLQDQADQIEQLVYQRYEKGPNRETAKKDAVALVLVQMLHDEHGSDDLQESFKPKAIERIQELNSKRTEAILATIDGNWAPMKLVILKSDMFPPKQGKADAQKTLMNLADSL